MAHGGPDHVLMVQTVVTVENVPIVPGAATEYAIETYEGINLTSASYAYLFLRTVPSGRIGILNAIELSTDNYAVATFEIIVKGVTIIDSEKLPESFTKEFPSLQLAPGEVISVRVKSDGSTLIWAYCDVSYKEVG